MKSTFALLAIATGLTAACDIPGVAKRSDTPPPAEEGLGAGATPAATPAPTPPVDTTTTAMQPNSPAPATPVATAKKPVRNTDQTQSGVTDASGSSTLGKSIRKARPDQDQPVTAKGDVLVARWDAANGGWTYRKPGDTTAVVRAPGETKGDTAFNQQKGDSLRMVAPPVTPAVPAPDSLGPQKGDTAFQRTQKDSMKVTGNDTMPAAPVPNTMPVMPTLPQPEPTPLPTPAPQPTPAPIPPR